MSGKRDFRKYRDTEGYVHAAGPGIAVNSGLCANNDNSGDDDIDDPIDCVVCLAIIEFVHKHRKPS